MVELKGITQTVKPGGVVIFNDATVTGWTPAIHREGSGIISLPSLGCGCSGARTGYKVTFGANVTIPTTVGDGETATTAPVSLAIAVEGEPDPTTEMSVFPAAAGNLFNVSRSTIVSTLGGCCVSVAIENTSAGTIEVQSPNLIIEREGGNVYAY